MELGALAIAARLVLFVAVLGLFGTAALGIYAPTAFAMARPRRAMIAATSAGAATTVLGLNLLAAQMTGALAGALDPGTLMTVATGTAAGIATLARFSVLAIGLVLMLCWKALARGPVAAMTGLFGVAAASLAWGGHAAASEGAIGVFRLTADILHLLAAGIWLGALLVFVHLIRRMDRDNANQVHASLAQFAGVGSGVVAVLLLTGVINLGLALGWTHLTSIVAMLWGRLLLLKIALFAAMLGLAALNRFRLTPALGVGDAASVPAAEAALRRSLFLETACALLVIALVAWLGTLAPLPDA